MWRFSFVTQALRSISVKWYPDLNISSAAVFRCHELSPARWRSHSMHFSESSTEIADERSLGYDVADRIPPAIHNRHRRNENDATRGRRPPQFALTLLVCLSPSAFGGILPVVVARAHMGISLLTNPGGPRSSHSSRACAVHSLQDHHLSNLQTQTRNSLRLRSPVEYSCFGTVKIETRLRGGGRSPGVSDSDSGWRFSSVEPSLCHRSNGIPT